MIKKIDILSIKLSDDFFSVSKTMGFDLKSIEEKYLEKIFNLMDLWIESGHIEIYEFVKERKYRRIKSSEKDQSPMYSGIYHARCLKKKNDPLIILSFTKDDYNFDKDPRYSVIISFIVNHDDIFGKMNGEKKDILKMEYIQKGIYISVYIYYKWEDLKDKKERLKKIIADFYFSKNGVIAKQSEMKLFMQNNLYLIKYNFLRKTFKYNKYKKKAPFI